MNFKYNFYVLILCIFFGLGIHAQESTFKIGSFSGKTLYLPDVYPGGIPTDLQYMGHNTSRLNVMSEDGFNVFSRYAPGYFTSVTSMESLLTLGKKNKMQVMTSAKDWYRPNADETDVFWDEGANGGTGAWVTYSTAPGTFDFNSTLGDRPNYEYFFDNVYGNPEYKDVIWGHQVIEESALFNLHNPTYGPPTGSWPYNELMETEIPLPFVLSAHNYFSDRLEANNITDHKLIFMEAHHHDGITENLITDTENMNPEAPYTAKHLIENLPDDSVYFEGSYVHFPENWYDQEYADIFGEGPKTRHYLGALKSIDFAKSELKSVHDVLDVAYGHQVYNSPGMSNSNWLWFQAYSSVIHGVDGIWFWGLGVSWAPGEKPADYDDNLARFSRENFPANYKNSIGHLAKELRYLADMDVLGTGVGRVNQKEVVTKLDEWDPYCVIQDSRIPKYKELPKEIRQKISKKKWNNEFLNTNNYNLRYTIRKSNNNVVMIIANPLPLTLKDVPLNFSAISNLANAKGVEVLFNGGESPYSTDYKQDRNSNIDLEFGNLESKHFIPFHDGKSIDLTFAPMDVHVLKFKFDEDIDYAGTDSWIHLYDYENPGNSCAEEGEDCSLEMIYDFEGDGSAVYNTPPLIGDIDNDGDDDMVFVFQHWDGVSGLVLRTKVSNGDGTWTTVTSVQGDGTAVHANPPMMGDVNNDGLDDIVFAFQHWDGISGLVLRTKLSNGDGTWTTVTSIQGDGTAVHVNRPMMGDVDGDGNDDIVFAFQHWDGISGLVLRTKLSNGDGTWNTVSSVQGDGSAVEAHPAMMGDVNGDGQDDIVFAFPHWDGVSGLVLRTKLSNGDGTWNTISSTLGDGSVVNASRAIMGDVNGDGRSDVVFAFQELGGETGLILRTKLSNGDGTWTNVTDIHQELDNIDFSIFRKGDFNGDCMMDLLFQKNPRFCQSYSPVIVLSKGDGTWISDILRNYRDRLSDNIVDVNGDGRDDIVTFFIGEEMGDFSDPGIDPEGLVMVERASTYTDQGCLDCSEGPKAALEFLNPENVETTSSYYGPTKVYEYCLDDEIIIDGSDSTCEDNYYIEIVEFDLATWMPIGTPLYSGWACSNGCLAPSDINITDFVSIEDIEPEKVYKLKLAVNAPWDEVNSFFSRIEDCPGKRRKEANFLNLEEKKQIQNGEIKVYPNPTKGNLTIELLEIENAENIRVYDTFGKILLSNAIESSVLKLDLAKYADGLYFIVISDENNIAINTTKIIKN